MKAVILIAVTLLVVAGEVALHVSHAQQTGIKRTDREQALDWARRQHVLSWELRSAANLARLRLRQGRRAQARNVLAPVRRRFTEGFRTAVLVRTDALLKQLAES